MPDRVKEKLVELLRGSLRETINFCGERTCKQCQYEKYDNDCKYAVRADHLIANGVTVQDEAKLYWKPVDEHISNLTCSACDSHLGCREDAKFCPECGAKFVINEAQPPKGE